MQNDTVANQVSALSVVYNSFEDQERRGMKRKLADVTLELERARMATEDARGAMVSNYSTNFHTNDPRHRPLSWKEFAVDRNSMCDHLVYEVLEPARELLEEARATIRGVFVSQRAAEAASGSGRTQREAVLLGALNAAHNSMVDTERVLRDDDSDDSESDPEYVSENDDE